jgi:hypothetical protein
MARIGPYQLRKLALEAIGEVAAASHLGTVPRTRGLALALAWLLHYGKEGETLPAGLLRASGRGSPQADA